PIRYGPIRWLTRAAGPGKGRPPRTRGPPGSADARRLPPGDRGWRAEDPLMCGIAGIVDLDGGPADGARVRAMCAAMTHRGPDDEGVHLGRGVALGMRRLAVLDLETGSQPIH